MNDTAHANALAAFLMAQMDVHEPANDAGGGVESMCSEWDQARDALRRDGFESFLNALTAWCTMQPGHVLWGLTQTMQGRDGRTLRGFQLVITDHRDGRTIWYENAGDLGELAALARVWLAQQ
jgi:hypothetical protein